MKKQLQWSILLLPLVALFAIFPLLWKGCSCGHDFDFHILSWMEAATQIAHGHLHPHWAFTPAFNAGEPRFVFYPPLSWVLGALLGLILPWSITPIVYTGLVLLAAGLGCYWLLKEFVPGSVAVLVAALYMVNPYMLFTAYERTAYAELLAAAWLPLLLLGVLRRQVTILGVAMPIALLWLTNAPAAVIGCYGIAILGAVRLLLTVREQGSQAAARFARQAVVGVVLGIGLASFYVVPAAYERRFVQIEMAMTDGMRITDNFLFHRTVDADHDAVLQTASLLAVGLLAAMAVTLLVGILQARTRGEKRRVLYALAALSGVIALLVMPPSAMIWSHAPELVFLQFPWRFLAILMPGLALALGLAMTAKIKPMGVISAALVAGVLLTLTGYRSFRQECDPEDTVETRLTLFQSTAGTDPTDEYTPMGADNDVLAKSNPAYWLASSIDAPPPAKSTAGALHGPIDIVLPAPKILVLNLRAYPAWRVLVNHALETARLPRNDGLIAIPIPAGAVHIDLAYGQSWDETVGDALSGAALFATGLLLRRRRLPLR